MKNKVGRGFSMGVLLSIMCLALVGCGGGSSGDSGATASVVVVDCSTVTSAATVTATSGVKFNPQNVPISVNGVVRWINADIQDHTVTSGTAPTSDGKFDQPLNISGPSVCLQFTAAGTYNYYCTYHYMVGMTGVVTVQ
jgi:plastocyanin